MDRRGLSNVIATRLAEEKARLLEHYAATEPGIGYFYVDDVFVLAQAALQRHRLRPGNWR